MNRSKSRRAARPLLKPPKHLLPRLPKVSSFGIEKGIFDNRKGETETEPELAELPSVKESNPQIRKPRSDSVFSTTSVTTTDGASYGKRFAARKSFSHRTKFTMHDLRHRFFRKPVIIFSRLDMLR